MTAAAQWLNETFANFDYTTMEFFHKLHDSSAGAFLDPVLNFITLLGSGGIFLIILSIFLILFRKTRKAGAAMLGGIIIGALFTNVALKTTIARPRPYADITGIFRQWWINAGSHVESDYSFPSGHTTSAMAAMTGLFFTTNKKVSWLAFLFAIAMGISRIYLCVHYPSDVLGGLIVGFIAGLLAALLINWFYKNHDKKLNNKIIDFDIISVFKKKA
jgi:undecaprenyl-diphosphatase